MSARCLGIEIGGTKLQLVAGQPNGRITERVRLMVDPRAGGEGIRRQIVEALPGLLAGGKFQAAGVGFGGPVDHDSGEIRCSHQVAGWADFPLGRWLEQHIGAGVRVDNDANVGALGEALLGAGRGFDPVFYVTLGSGVGGGLVVNGAIYHGASPGESEVGHLRLDRSGLLVEQRCSGWAIDARIRAGLAAGRQTVLRDLAVSAGGEARHLGAALEVGDPFARELIAQLGADLGFALSHVVHLVHPSAIVLGGGLSLVGEPLRAAVDTALAGFVMEAFGTGPHIFPSLLKEDSVPCGALLLAARAA